MPLSSTPTPWRFCHSSWEYSFIYDGKDEVVAQCHISPDVTEDTQAQHEAAKDAVTALIVKSVNAFEPMREALRRANAFISNGVELGYIRMPDPRIGDPASETPAIIRAALKLAGDAT